MTPFSTSSSARRCSTTSAGSLKASFGPPRRLSRARPWLRWPRASRWATTCGWARAEERWFSPRRSSSMRKPLIGAIYLVIPAWITAREAGYRLARTATARLTRTPRFRPACRSSCSRGLRPAARGWWISGRTPLPDLRRLRSGPADDRPTGTAASADRRQVAAAAALVAPGRENGHDYSNGRYPFAAAGGYGDRGRPNGVSTLLNQYPRAEAGGSRAADHPPHARDQAIER